MKELVIDEVQSLNYQRRWLEGMVLPGGSSVLMLINIPILGVGLDGGAMVADVSARYRELMDSDRVLEFTQDDRGRPVPGSERTWSQVIKRDGVKPILISESNMRSRTWYIGPEGLMKWDADSDSWRYMSDVEAADTDLLKIG